MVLSMVRSCRGQTEDERDACYYTNVAGKDEPATAILDSKLQAIKPTGGRLLHQDWRLRVLAS